MTSQKSSRNELLNQMFEATRLLDEAPLNWSSQVPPPLAFPRTRLPVGLPRWFG